MHDYAILYFSDEYSDVPGFVKCLFESIASYQIIYLHFFTFGYDKAMSITNVQNIEP